MDIPEHVLRNLLSEARAARGQYYRDSKDEAFVRLCDAVESFAASLIERIP